MDIYNLVLIEERSAKKQKSVALALYIQSKINAIKACIIELREWQRRAIEAEERIVILNEMYVAECKNGAFIASILQAELLKKKGTSIE